MTAWTWTDQRSGIFRLSCFLLHRQQRLIHCRGSKCRFGKFSLESRSFPIGVYRSVFQLFIANHLNIVMTIASSDINSYLSWAIVRCIGFRVLRKYWETGNRAHRPTMTLDLNTLLKMSYLIILTITAPFVLRLWNNIWVFQFQIHETHDNNKKISVVRGELCHVQRCETIETQILFRSLRPIAARHVKYAWTGPYQLCHDALWVEFSCSRKACIVVLGILSARYRSLSN